MISSINFITYSPRIHLIFQSNAEQEEQRTNSTRNLLKNKQKAPNLPIQSKPKMFMKKQFSFGRQPSGSLTDANRTPTPSTKHKFGSKNTLSKRPDPGPSNNPQSQRASKTRRNYQYRPPPHPNLKKSKNNSFQTLKNTKDKKPQTNYHSLDRHHQKQSASPVSRKKIQKPLNPSTEDQRGRSENRSPAYKRQLHMKEQKIPLIKASRDNESVFKEKSVDLLSRFKSKGFLRSKEDFKFNSNSVFHKTYSYKIIKARDVRSGKRLYAKIYKKANIGVLGKESSVNNEILALQSLKNAQFFIRLESIFEDKTRLFLMFERFGVPGDADEVIKFQFSDLKTPFEKKVFLTKILVALIQVNALGVAVTEFALKNIVGGDKDHPRVFNFDCLTAYDQFPERPDVNDFTPPEVRIGAKVSSKTDSWIFGVLVVYIFTGEFFPMQEKSIYKASMLRLQMNDSMNPKLYDIIKKLLNINIGRRMAIDKAILHPFFSDFILNSDEIFEEILPENFKEVFRELANAKFSESPVDPVDTPRVVAIKTINLKRARNSILGHLGPGRGAGMLHGRLSSELRRDRQRRMSKKAKNSTGGGNHSKQLLGHNLRTEGVRGEKLTLSEDGDASDKGTKSDFSGKDLNLARRPKYLALTEPKTLKMSEKSRDRKKVIETYRAIREQSAINRLKKEQQEEMVRLEKEQIERKRLARETAKRDGRGKEGVVGKIFGQWFESFFGCCNDD